MSDGHKLHVGVTIFIKNIKPDPTDPTFVEVFKKEAERALRDLEQLLAAPPPLEKWKEIT